MSALKSRARYDLDAVKDGLRERLEDMIHDRLPGAHRANGIWQVGSLNGEKGQSLTIWTRAGGVGAWRDHSTGDKGDILALYAQLYHGTNTVDAKVIESAADFAQVSADPTTDTPETLAARQKVRVERQRRAEAKETEEAKAREKKRRYWFAQWMKAHPCTPDDPVWSYLATRGIDAGSLMVSGKLPGAIRYAPDWPFWKEGEKFGYPAMVAQLCGKGPEGGIVCLAVHVTYLEHVGDVWQAKFSGKDKRRVFGAARGGLIPLWKGGSTVSFAKASRKRSLILCEGIEDGLTLAMACPESYVGAAYSLGNLTNLQSPSPEGFGEVVIAADNDWANPTAAPQVMAARRRILGSGRHCRVVYSEIGKDFNDHLNAYAGATV